MDKDFLFETNKHNDLAARAHAGATEHQETETRAIDRDAPYRESRKPTLATVEFGSGWYHAAAVKHAHKA